MGWGKVLGTLFGFMFAKLPGAILGFICGHMFDKGYSQSFDKVGGFTRFFNSGEQLEKQAMFFHTLFSVMGHLAKSTGRVSEKDIKMATLLMEQMELKGDVLIEAQNAFRDGKSPNFPLEEQLLDFKKSCHGRWDIMQIYLEILIQACFVDGAIQKPQLAILSRVAETLGFERTDLDRLIVAFQAEFRFHKGRQKDAKNEDYSLQHQLVDAYKILGLSPKTDLAEIKTQYKKLMVQHHPDKLRAKGLPQQAMDHAKKRTQEIQAAYELVKKHKQQK